MAGFIWNTQSITISEWGGQTQRRHWHTFWLCWDFPHDCSWSADNRQDTREQLGWGRFWTKGLSQCLAVRTGPLDAFGRYTAEPWPKRLETRVIQLANYKQVVQEWVPVPYGQVSLEAVAAYVGGYMNKAGREHRNEWEKFAKTGRSPNFGLARLKNALQQSAKHNSQNWSNHRHPMSST